MPGYSFRKCVPTGVGSNLGFDASLRGMAHTKVNPVVFICFFNEKIFQSIFAVRRRERLLANLAMDQSMRKTSIGFHAHDLIA